MPLGPHHHSGSLVEDETRGSDPAFFKSCDRGVGRKNNIMLGEKQWTNMRNRMPSVSPASRALRLFVSSTFRDLQREREHLIKETFPQLQRICEARRVDWSVVDLRWGITEAQSRRRETLSVCLQEVERCRPFFLGILGNRYGSRPAIPADLVAAYPWLAQCAGRSITELEILHGALNSTPSVTSKARFYFRAAFDGGQTDDGEPGHYSPEDPSGASALADLKQRIRKSHFPVREGFQSPQELGDQVLEDFTAIIEECFPAEATPSSSELARLQQIDFAHSHALSYISLDPTSAVLERSRSGVTRRLAIVAGNGMGKSALLADWLKRLQEDGSGTFVIYYAAGLASLDPGRSDDWQRTDHGIALAGHRASPLRYLLDGLNDHFHFTESIPDHESVWPQLLRTWLDHAGKQSRVVLLLDSLDRVIPASESLPNWLPRQGGQNISWVVSCQPGTTANALRTEGWTYFDLPPLAEEQRRSLAEKHLVRYGKSLDEDSLRRIVAHAATANPLYLRTLLDELRIFGIHDLIKERLDYYLAARDTAHLYELAIAQWERDYEEDRPNLVRDALVFLAVSRHGLHETELLDLLGRSDGKGSKDDEWVRQLKALAAFSSDITVMKGGGGAGMYKPLPQARLSPLLLRAEHAINRRAGRLTLENNELRNAIHQRYLRDPESETAARIEIATYFSFLEMGARRCEELPWQLLQTSRWSELKECLTGLGMFTHLFNYDSAALAGYWKEIGTRYDIVQSYVDALNSTEPHPVDFLLRLAVLPQLIRLIPMVTGRPYLAFPFLKMMYDFDEGSARRMPLEALSGWIGQARAYLALDAVDQAAPILNKAWKHAEEDLRPTDDEPDFDPVIAVELRADLLDEMGRVHRLQGMPYNAAPCHAEAVELRRKSGASLTGLASSLFYLGQSRHEQGGPAQAEPLLREALELWNQTPGRHSQERAGTLAALGSVLRDLGRFEEAESVLSEALSICDQFADEAVPALFHVLIANAVLSRRRGDLARAEALYRRILAMRSLSLRDEAVGLRSLAIVLTEQGKYDQANASLERAFANCERCHPPDYHEQLVIQRIRAEILSAQGRHQEAIELFEAILPEAKEHGLVEELTTLRVLAITQSAIGDQRGLVKTLLAQAQVSRKGENLEAAIETLQQAIAACPPSEAAARSTATALLALYQQQYGNPDQALGTLRDLETQGRQSEDLEHWYCVLSALVATYQAIGHLGEVDRLLEEQARACLNGQDPHALAEALLATAEILTTRGSPLMAKAINDCGIHWCRRHGLNLELICFVGQQGHVSNRTGDHEQALAFHREAESLAEKADDIALQIIGLTSIAATLDDHFHRLDEALIFAQKADRLATERDPEMKKTSQRCLQVILRRIAEREQADTADGLQIDSGVYWTQLELISSLSQLNDYPRTPLHSG